ncbi:Aldo/keto reductase [Schizophyllum amplum]|uniref:Aldo/keto reductase n=1 Tax=Schizophyllum amplum TaxID=97359 RepID=A0A550CN48_9AGAR|nr:Aldo/keto reductase [Auriculariopsis ampla]
MTKNMKMPTRQLGKNGPQVCAIGYGAMGMGAFYGKTDEQEALDALTWAADNGATFWDTADIYGTSEATIGKWFASTGRRKEIFLATKFGGRDLTPGSSGQPNNQPEYQRYRIETAFKTLQTDHIDLFYQHRIDPKVPVEVVMEGFRPYIEAGKISWIGLSECTAATLERAKAVPGVGERVVAAQMEFSPFELTLEKDGFLDAARKLGVAIVAYSPLGRGMITGRFKSPKDFEEGDFRVTLPRFSEENFPKNVQLVEKFQQVAQKYSATPGQIALAWILAEHPDFIPIPGSRGIPRLEENMAAAKIKLAPEDVKQLRAHVESADVVGTRYTEAGMQSTVGNCIPLAEWKGSQSSA